MAETVTGTDARIAWARLTIGTAVILVLAYTYALGTGGVNPFDFFGYFTNLTNLLTAILLITTGLVTLRRPAKPAPLWLRTARGVAVACMLIVGVIYNVVVPGTGSAPPWVSVTLHIIMPAITLLDWVCVGDRGVLPWRHSWAVLPYPLLWLGVVLVRGATDGWVPYGFLLPAHGAGALAATCVGLLVSLAVSGAIVWGLSRFGGVICRAPRDALQ
ncbi:Pr6Pr family membrane protein [Leucobacter japonicus]|uniref:Pr6Pr family membrane protein n=1 Tax=Leucobacter japonicus TaxID=1461259 RepID=UPI0006A79FB6|nr:Pr6Pr family membrane protein [Leucobacter japonicus]